MNLRVRVDAPADVVFRSLTDPDELTEWLAESAEVDLDDGRYEFWGRYTPGGDQPHQRLLDSEPGRRLQFSWDLGGDTPSTVEITIAPSDAMDGEAGSIVTIEHTGLPAEGFSNEAFTCFWYVSAANLAAQSE